MVTDLIINMGNAKQLNIQSTKKLKICGYQNIVYYYGNKVYSKYGIVKYFQCGHSMVSQNIINMASTKTENIPM